MNINFNIGNSYVKPQQFGAFAKDSEGAGEKSTDAKQDRVNISADAAAYQLANGPAKAIAGELAQLGESPRLAAICAQIRDGSYDVSANDIADSILNRAIF